MHAERHTEFSIYLDQRPGELAGVLGALGEHGVQLAAVNVAEHNSRAVVRLLGRDTETLRHACESLVDSGVSPIVETEVVVVDMSDRPNALREIAVALAAARVNIRYAYLAQRGPGLGPRCILKVSDIEPAMATIEPLP
ncbi:MAG: hypothetical protein KF902_02085 [Phycisphaeraceae bacterium]|nr:hypothetical protein [Phycisphaeraceae bacterium]MCW5768812.1 hypothetical protein [Phycisphaeraceae bacterium]